MHPTIDGVFQYFTHINAVNNQGEVIGYEHCTYEIRGGFGVAGQYFRRKITLLAAQFNTQFIGWERRFLYLRKRHRRRDKQPPQPNNYLRLLQRRASWSWLKETGGGRSYWFKHSVNARKTQRAHQSRFMRLGFVLGVHNRFFAHAAAAEVHNNARNEYEGHKPGFAWLVPWQFFEVGFIKNRGWFDAWKGGCC